MLFYIYCLILTYRFSDTLTMLLLAITSFTTKAKIVVTITQFYVKVTHLFLIYTYKSETEMLQKKHYKVYNTNLSYIGIFKSKPLQCPQ